MFNFKRKITQIYPAFDSNFRCNAVHSSHFMLPVVALVSFKLATALARLFKPTRSTLGSLLLIELEKISE